MNWIGLIIIIITSFLMLENLSSLKFYLQFVAKVGLWITSVSQWKI